MPLRRAAMSKWRYRSSSYMLIRFLTLSLTCLTLTAEIRGRVTSTSGAPISGATVITPLLFQATTNAMGEYILSPRARPDWTPKLVIFYAPGFRPLVKLLSDGDDVIDGVLGPADGTERHVKACSVSKAKIQMMGSIRFTVPLGVKTSAMTDTDYTLTNIVYRSNGKPYALRIWEGSSCCNGRPLNDNDVVASAGTMSTWIFADPTDASRRFGGLDMRGKRANGTNWRTLGPPLGSQIEYKDVPDAVSAVFDAIIDSMCVIVP
jgi:hypothetical protein